MYTICLFVFACVRVICLLFCVLRLFVVFVSVICFVGDCLRMFVFCLLVVLIVLWLLFDIWGLID